MRFFHALRDLNKSYTPKRRGVVAKEEMEKISSKLYLDTLNVDDLRNLRDFTVMYYNSLIERERGEDNDNNKEMLELHDKMSAIVCVIDNKLFSLGEEV